MGEATYRRIKTVMNIAKDNDQPAEVRQTAEKAVEAIDSGASVRSQYDQVKKIRSSFDSYAEQVEEQMNEGSGPDPFEAKVRALAKKLPTMAAVYEQVKDGYGSGYSAFTGWCRRHGIEFEFRDPRAWEKYALSQRGVLERSSETVSAAARFLSELDVRALDPERIPEALERLGGARTNLTKAIRKLEELA